MQLSFSPVLFVSMCDTLRTVRFIVTNFFENYLLIFCFFLFTYPNESATNVRLSLKYLTMLVAFSPWLKKCKPQFCVVREPVYIFSS